MGKFGDFVVHIFIIISQMFARIPDCTGLQTESGFAGSRINLLDARFPTHPDHGESYMDGAVKITVVLI